QAEHPPFPTTRRATRTVAGPAGAINHAVLAVLDIPADPFAHGAHRDVEPLSGADTGPAVLSDTPGHTQPSRRSQRRVSVGHEDLRCGCGCLVAFTPHTEVFLMSARHPDRRHNVHGQYN